MTTLAKRVKKSKVFKKPVRKAERPDTDPWDDMPEFVQGDKGAIARVVVNFETEADMAAFNEATGLKVTVNTKGVFYPHKPARKLRYEDES